MEFVPVARPEVTRTRKPNPYADTVASLAEDREKTLAVEMPYSTPEDVKKVEGAISLIQAAGRSHNVSIRKILDVRTEGSGKSEKTVATLTVWAVDKITRARD